jgi:hypothetical protein
MNVPTGARNARLERNKKGVRTGRFVSAVRAHNAGVSVTARAGDRLESQCWCCGAVDNPGRMIGLGNHPEVRVCPRCARWLGKRAGELADRGRTGPAVLVRRRLRAARRTVIDRGWHHHPVFGVPLRWIGRHLP